MPNPTPERTAHNQLQRDYYEDRKLAENHRIAVRATPYVLNHLDELERRAELSRDEDILDIGCGMGKYTIPLAERGFKVSGLELSPYLVETLQAHAEGRAEIDARVGDILDPDEDLLQKFDRVVGFFVLHHLHDIPASYKSAARLLRPGGRIAILEPNPFCPLYYLQITLSPTMSWAAEKGILSLKPGETRTALSDAGFTDIEIHKFGIAPPFVRNRSFGPAIDSGFDKVTPLRGMAAFQLITGRLS